MILKCIAVGIGGFLGSVARYLISLVPLQTHGNYPVNTFLANILGALIIGVVIALAQNSDMEPEKILFLKVGLCGGLTTFSTFSVETLGFIQSGSFWMAAAYVLASVVICVAGVYCGIRIGNMI